MHCGVSGTAWTTRPRTVFALLLAVWLSGCSAAGIRRAEPAISRIAFGSCLHQDQPQPIWDAVLAAEPDVFVFLGDNVYADTEDMATMRAVYERQAASSGLRRLRAAADVVATWDDHDYGVDDGGADFAAKEGAKVEFLRFFDVPEGAPVRSRPGIYSARIYGPPGRRVQLILLDTRSFRGPLVRRPEHEEDPVRGRYLPQTDPEVTLLGEAQWAWLDDRLREPAELRLVASSVQLVAEEHGWEKWANLPHERRRLLELLGETGASGVVLLSGDRHLAEISRLAAAEGIGYPLYDVTASGLNQSGGGRDDEPNRHRVGPNFRRDNFGLIEVDWSARDPELRLEIRDVEGEVRLSARVALGELSGP